jgi:CHASE1-domain containing sensor protein
MEKFYFALGVLSMIGILFSSVIVWGLLKVIKNEKKQKSFEEQYRWDFENSHRRFDESNRIFDERIDSFSRNISEEFKRIEQECKSYTDKRFDKVK